MCKASVKLTAVSLQPLYLAFTTETSDLEWNLWLKEFDGGVLTCDMSSTEILFLEDVSSFAPLQLPESKKKKKMQVDFNEK